MKLARNLERAATLEFCAALRRTFAEKGGGVPGSVAVVGVYLEAARSTGEEHDELTFVTSLADAQMARFERLAHAADAAATLDRIRAAWVRARGVEPTKDEAREQLWILAGREVLARVDDVERQIAAEVARGGASS